MLAHISFLKSLTLYLGVFGKIVMKGHRLVMCPPWPQIPDTNTSPCCGTFVTIHEPARTVTRLIQIRLAARSGRHPGTTFSWLSRLRRSLQAVTVAQLALFLMTVLRSAGHRCGGVV